MANDVMSQATSTDSVMSQTALADLASFRSISRWAAVLTAVGGASVIGALWMVFFWVPTESTMGIMQRIYYIHIPTAWLGEFAFGIVALCSAGYLLLRDDRLDSIAVSAAEVGFIFLTGTLVAGPLWARLAWGSWWVWDARLSFSLLLWLIWIGYFVIRGGAEEQEKGKRMAAVLAIIGSLDIPLIHMSVYWFRTVHPMPVIMNPEGPTADFEIGMTIAASVTSFTLAFFGILLYRYGYERLRRQADVLRYAQAIPDR
ncbi:MAG: cytochrome C assembly protein [Gemmatimonas sp.]|nr:cytochrome C assembly protein [Gemmatimonas sp.]